MFSSRVVALLVLCKGDEVFQAHDVFLVRPWITRDIRCRDDQSDFFIEHFLHLLRGDALLQGAKVFSFVTHAVRLVENLPPSVFAGGFCS